MRRIDQIEPFRVMQLLERTKILEAQGIKIIHMEIGEPDFPTPISIIEAAKKQLDIGDNFYAPSTGIPELQESLSLWYKKEYNLNLASERILITPGASGAFSLLYATLLDPKESVLLSDPGYPCQRNFIRMAGGKAISIPVGPKTQYQLSAGLIEQHWQKNSRAALIINPSNPTGTVLNKHSLANIAKTCRKLGGYLISDEIYQGLTYDVKAHSALELDEHAIVVNSFSKRWAMTGWRIGWVVVPDELINPCRRVMQNIFISSATLSQYAAIAALQEFDQPEKMRLAYNKRRKYLLQELPKLGFEIVIPPQGAFYIYANIEKISSDSSKLCRDLLEQAGVAVTPGEDFGSFEASKHLRFSYATCMNDIQEGVRRIQEFLR